jgi:tetratricopeptide (TPR) repeat protein
MARAALLHLLSQSRPAPPVLPQLKDLFISADAELSSLAIRAAANWKIQDAASWIQERILLNRPLSPDQIAAMVETLGVTPGESAYEMLKATEAGMAGKRTSLWMSYYDALLSHGRREDIDTLITLYADPEQDEALRRNAMQILVHRTDPVLNPSDLLFGNIERIQGHLTTRLDLLLEAAGDRTGFDPARKILLELRPYLEVLRPENVSVAREHLRDALQIVEDIEPFHRDLALSALNGQNRCKPNSEEAWALTALGLCGFISGLIERAVPSPPLDAPWEKRLAFVLTDHFLKPVEFRLIESIVQDAPREELMAKLTEALEATPFTWKTYQAMEMLGLMDGSERADDMARVVQRVKDPALHAAAERAFTRMGWRCTRSLVSLLDSAAANERGLALRVISQHPTHRGVDEILQRFTRLFREETAALLQAVEEMGADAFLPILESEYRPGEWRIAQALLRLGRIAGRDPGLMKELEREVAEHERLLRQQEALLTRGFRDWPDRIDLDLCCKQCGRKYTYAVREVHLHPHRKSELEPDSPGGAPYQHGIVICDDLRCKNCNALNDFAVTRETIGQISAESLRLLALHRSKVSLPPYYPVKHVEAGDKEGPSQSLVDIEKESVAAVHRNPSQARAQLALGKFYEYVKAFPKARTAFLKALDVDARSLEAMAGLARLDHSEGKLEEAYDWIDRCYADLPEGHIHLAQDVRQFKKAVREKRRNLARALGIHPEEAPVKVRFQIDSPDYPKNRPCPCGSGKKYKLCCMTKDSSQG